MKHTLELPGEVWLSSEDMAIVEAFRRVNGIPDPAPAPMPVCA